MEAPASTRFRWHLALIALVAAAVRLTYVLAVVRHRPLGLDAESYRELGLGIRDGLGYVGTDKHATATFPPAYATYLAAASLALGRSILAMRVATAALGVGSVALIGMLGRRIAGPFAGLIAAGLAAVYLPLVTTDGSLMAEPLYLLLVLVTVHLAITLRDHVGLGWAAAVGFGIGIAALTRSEAMLLIPLVALPAVVAGRADRRRGAVAFATVLVVPLLVLLPWHVRNARAFSEPVWFSGNSATAVAGTACDRHFYGAETALWTFGCLAQRHPRPFADQAALYNALRHQATEYTTGHLSAMPRVVAVRELRTLGLWAPGQQATFEAPEGRVRGWQLAAWAMYLAVAAVAVVGFVQTRRARLRLLPLVGMLAVVVVSSALTYGNQRFRLTAEPALLVLAAIALTRWRRGSAGWQPDGT